MGLLRENGIGFRPSARADESWTPTVPRRHRPRAVCLLALGTGLCIGLGAQDARAQSCETTGVEITAISQAEYETLAAAAGPDACVTSRSPGMTLCQILPLTSDEWTVVGQASPSGGDAQSAVEVEVYSGLNCYLNGSTPVETTNSRWVKAVAVYEIPANPPPLDFIAIMQIGGGNLEATVCSYGDGADGKHCTEWNGRY